MRLYREFTSREAIDREYDAAAAVADSAAIVERWGRESARVREALPCRLGLRYGPTRAEYLDLFPAGPGAPLHLFFHGGYWRRFSARDFSFVVEPLVAEGIAVAVVNYALCPQVTIDEIVRQARAAVAWAFVHARELGCDPDRITVSGHSAGGHLVAMLACTDWPGGYDLPADLLKAGAPVSGLFDLGPFPWSFLQPWLRLDLDQVVRNSPILQLPDRGPPLLLIVGAEESGEFRRQSASFLEAWCGRGLPGALLEVEGADHFTVLDRLVDPGHALFARLAQLAREPDRALDGVFAPAPADRAGARAQERTLGATAGRAAPLRIAHVLETALYVDDLAAARRFYVELLGLSVHGERPGVFLFLRLERAMLLLFDPTATIHQRTPPPHGARGPGHVCFAVPEAELDAWRARLEAAGVAIEHEQHWPGGGRSLYVRDPAGNSVEFASPRIWGFSEP